MSDKFDELAKAMAQSVTRRGALKKFGVGLAGIALAALGTGFKTRRCDCSVPGFGCNSSNSGCYKACLQFCSGG